MEYLTKVSQEKWNSVAACVLVLVTVLVVQATVANTRNAWYRIPLIGAELGSDEKRRQLYFREPKKIYAEGYKRVSALTLLGMHILTSF